MKRRKFLKTALLAGTSAALIRESPVFGEGNKQINATISDEKHPVILSTWDFQLPVNEKAYEILQGEGNLLDAVEKSISIVEDDPRITSVGRGGYPDREGHVTLDACIMDEQGRAGSVLFLEHIAHPISVARLVMEKTPHVILAGEGALQFALENGFKKENILTNEAKDAYQKWLKESKYSPTVNERNHDTIGLVVRDRKGNLAGGCSTSGMAWKIRGRVGDSPIIGAGLYVDNEIGAATATGIGEAVIKIAGSFLIVELMRQGKAPQDACRLALERMVKKQPQYHDAGGFTVGFVALNKAGDVGAMSYRKGLQYSLHKGGVNRIIDADYLVKS
jgi:isoaspartyl peptidase/L-asparaginase-like protein (Ntn-hydrolase superfamily)